MKNKNIPELRFPEFKKDGEWEEQKFDQLCKFIRGPFGGALKKEIFVKTGYVVYEQSHAIYNDFSSFRYFITEEKFNELKRFSVFPFDIIMSCSGSMGKFAIVPKEAPKGIINQALLKLTVKDGYDVDFVKEILELPINQDQLLSQSAGGAIKNVAEVAQIKEIKLSIPILKEQQKIASCLSWLDEVIAANSQKLEALKVHKKGLMQNLFPQDGETVPKWRFKEFAKDGAWVEKILDDVAIFLKGKGISKADIVENGSLPCIRYGELYTHYNETISIIKSYTNSDTKDLVMSEENDVIIPASGETQIDIATASCVLLQGIALGGDLNIIRSKINGVFLSYYLNNVKKNEIAQMAQGIAVVHLYPNQLKNLIIQFPKPKEQQKIASSFSSLDVLIIGVVEKIESLKLHKKGLMQGLFPKVIE
jgi:type I restriction enzyme S subunit